MVQSALICCLASMSDMHWTDMDQASSREPFDVAEGHWWRFDAYVIRDGCVRPATGARLEPYDPWDQYRAARDGNLRADPPYASLVELVGTVTNDPETMIEGETVRLGTSSEAKLVRWCAEHGLIGLLPHQTVLASLAPRWDTVPDAGNVLLATRHVHRWDVYGCSPTIDPFW